MKYIYDYAIMSAVFLIIIVIMYFSKRQFPDSSPTDETKPFR